VPGAAAAIAKLKNLGKKIFYVTNNSTKSRDEYLKKFHGLNFEANKDEIYSTSYAAACYLQDINFDKKVYIVGSRGIAEELDNVKIKHSGVGPDFATNGSIDYVHEGVNLDPEIGAVLVGFDDYFSYNKIMKASSYLKKPDCLFLATNTDETFPVGLDHLTMPGTGSLVASIKVASDRNPIVLGKPVPYLFEAIAKRHAIQPERTIMIGDRLNTDILFGANCGLKTLLVLTGIASEIDVEEIQKHGSSEDKKMIPDYYTDSIGSLAKFIDN